MQVYQGASHLMTLEAFSFLDCCLADKAAQKYFIISIKN
jgi:hypothetical protein